MSNLITIDGDNAQLTAEALDKIVHYERIIKRMKAEEDDFKRKLLEEMENAGVLKIESDDLAITYVAETTRESLDSRKLREEMPDVYDDYCKISPVKASVRIKLK